jgi:hypothetical protein
MEGLRLKVYTVNAIRRQGKEVPSVEVDIGVIAILMGIQQEKVAAKILLKEIKILEYYRREHMREFSRQVNNQSANNVLTTLYDEYDHKLGRGSVQSRQAPSRQQRGTLAGVQDMFSRFFGANPTVANQNDFNTPDKRSNYTDILRGSGPEERPFSKQVGMSHA